MIFTSLVVAAGVLFFSEFVHRQGIRLAHRFSLLDMPSPRRRHRAPTPIIGGVGIFFTWSLGMIAFSFLQPQWFSEHVSSIIPTCASLLILITLGIFDDVRGLTPKPKFLFQAIAAAIVIVYEPNVHYLCLAWKSVIGNAVWPLMAFWIVGITNAINLVDGLDGLAGGTALLVSVSIAVVSFLSDGFSGVQGVSMALLAGSIIGFLRFNWCPAKIFLGDNGSLPLGFMIAINSLTCHAHTHSWVVIASTVLMLGYPILDMGLAVLRRYQSGLELFKADRNHLHFKVQRLGLDSGQTAIFLLSISLYLQVSALSLQLLPVSAVLPAIALVLFSIFGLLYVIRCIERSRVNRLSSFKENEKPALHVVRDDAMVVQIQLGPIFEVGLLEEKVRFKDLITSLEMILKTTASKNEIVSMQNMHIQVLLERSLDNQPSLKSVQKKYEEKLQKFCAMVDLQCSMSTIPVKVKKIVA